MAKNTGGFVEIPIPELNELVELADSGQIRTKIQRGPRRSGDVLGTATPNGYLTVGIKSKRFLAHRVAFALANGRWPTMWVDHINGDKKDNRPENLREASVLESSWNTPGFGASGVKGISFRQDRGFWRAEITVRGVKRYLGSFKCKEMAELAYVSASERFHGKFSRVA